MGGDVVTQFSSNDYFFEVHCIYNLYIAGFAMCIIKCVP